MRLQLLLLLATSTSYCLAFSPAVVQRASRTVSPLNAASDVLEETGIEIGVIKGIKEDDGEVDFGRCGVKMTADTVVKMSGMCNKKNSAEWDILDNYSQVVDLDDKQQTMVVASALGIEDYQEVGDGTDKVVLYGPIEAANSVIAAMDAAKVDDDVVINIAGGDDLQVEEVLMAIEMVAKEVKGSVAWNSLSFAKFPSAQATMVVTSVKKPAAKKDDDEDDNGLKGTAKALSMGEVYLMNDKYVTVVEEDVISDFSKEWV